MKPEERRRQAFDKRAIYPGWRGGKPLTIEGGYCCPCNTLDTYTEGFFKVGKEESFSASVAAPINYSSLVYSKDNEYRLCIAFGKDSSGNATAIDFSNVEEVWLNLGLYSYGIGRYRWYIDDDAASRIWAPLWIMAYAITSTWGVGAIPWASQPTSVFTTNGNSFVNPSTSMIDNYLGSVRVGEGAAVSTITDNNHHELEDLEISGSVEYFANNDGIAYPQTITGSYKGAYGVTDVREQVIRMQMNNSGALTAPIYGIVLIPFTLYDLQQNTTCSETTTWWLDQNEPTPATVSYYYDVFMVTQAHNGYGVGANYGFPFDTSLLQSGTELQDMGYATMGYNITNDKALLLIPASC